MFATIDIKFYEAYNLASSLNESSRSIFIKKKIESFSTF